MRRGWSGGVVGSGDGVNSLCVRVSDGGAGGRRVIRQASWAMHNIR